MFITREEFEEWLFENTLEALGDDMIQTDTTPRQWLVRYSSALNAVLSREIGEAAEEGDMEEEEESGRRRFVNPNDDDEDA